MYVKIFNDSIPFKLLGDHTIPSVHPSIHCFNPAVSNGRILCVTSCTILLPWRQASKGERHSQNVKSRMNDWEGWCLKWPALICLCSGVACLHECWANWWDWPCCQAVFGRLVYTSMHHQNRLTGLSNAREEMHNGECALVKITDNVFEGPAGLFCFYAVIVSASYKVQFNGMCLCMCV